MYRIALGYDLHRLQNQMNSSIVCGGVKLSCDYNIEGAHSDGDVVFHALTDALFSINNTDIGQVFSNTDPNNYQKDSKEFLIYAFDQMKNKYRIVNIDIVIICDLPKIAPYINAMKSKIEEYLQVSQDDISIRGKTTENTNPLTIQAYTNVLFQKITK